MLEPRYSASTGLALSAIGLGCNNFGRRIDQHDSNAVVGEAVGLGITHFDTADVYGEGASETILGRALKRLRDDVVVATKFGISRSAPGGTDASRKHVIKACEASLTRLNTDYIDLYYLHQPDQNTPREETVAALSQLVDQGKIRYFACSNLPSWQVADMWHHARASPPRSGFACVQLEWSLLNRSAEGDLVPACREFGLGIVVYAPLASGLLTGKYHQGQPWPAGSRFASWPGSADAATAHNLKITEQLRQFAAAHDRSLVGLALPWVTGHAGVTSVLVGATSLDQLRENVAASQRRLSADELAALDDVLAEAEKEDPHES